jgi:PIN domain nuclease of toxin-antitoxin system
MDDLNDLLWFVIKKKEHCYELALEALDENDTFKNSLHTARASAFEQVEKAIKDKLKELEDFNENFTAGQIKTVNVEKISKKTILVV